MTFDRKLDAFYCIMAMLVGGFMLWLGSSAVVIEAMCWFMAGGFFQRAMTGERP